MGVISEANCASDGFRADLKLVYLWQDIKYLAKRVGVKIYYQDDGCHIYNGNHLRVYRGYPTLKELRAMLQARCESLDEVWKVDDAAIARTGLPVLEMQPTAGKEETLNET